MTVPRPDEPRPAPLLHVAAFWVASDRGDEMADLLTAFKIRGTRGAVVTFSEQTANDPRFRHTMDRLDLSEVNDHPRGLPRD